MTLRDLAEDPSIFPVPTITTRLEEKSISQMRAPPTIKESFEEESF